MVAPVQAAIANTSTVVIETDGPLWRVPFNVLVDATGKYFANSRNITFVPTVIPITDRRRTISTVSADDRVLLVQSPSADPATAPLSDIDAESEVIARQFAAAQVLDSDNLDSERLKQQLRIASVFHFAGHAMPRWDGAGLVIGRTPQPDEAPALLTASSVTSRTIPEGKLVVLAACATELGGDGGAADSGSLVRAFLRSGVPSVVAAKWPVDSAATVLFMSAFYRRVISGEPIGSAVSQAAESVRTIQHYSHPYYWAAFNAFGQNEEHIHDAN
jgi:CHAT domain-containing protein